MDYEKLRRMRQRIRYQRRVGKPADHLPGLQGKQEGKMERYQMSDLRMRHQGARGLGPPTDNLQGLP